MYKFRTFQADDANEIFNLAKKAWDFTYKDIFPKDKIEDFVNRAYDPERLTEIEGIMRTGYTDFQVALENEKIIGFFQIGYNKYWQSDFEKKNDILLFRLYLDPEYIGEGIGSKLLSLAENWVKSEGQSTYGLEVHFKNVLGINFYQRKGFLRNSKRDDLEQGHWFMEKTI